jgi:hypothetical protein
VRRPGPAARRQRPPAVPAAPTEAGEGVSPGARPPEGASRGPRRGAEPGPCAFGPPAANGEGKGAAGGSSRGGRRVCGSALVGGFLRDVLGFRPVATYGSTPGRVPTGKQKGSGHVIWQ